MQRVLTEIVRKQDEKLHLWDTEDESENLVLNAGCSLLLDLSKSSYPFPAHNPAPIRTTSRAKALQYRPPLFHSNQANILPFNAANCAASSRLTNSSDRALTDATPNWKNYSFVNSNTPIALLQLWLQCDKSSFTTCFVQLLSCSTVIIEMIVLSFNSWINILSFQQQSTKPFKNKSPLSFLFFFFLKFCLSSSKFQHLPSAKRLSNLNSCYAFNKAMIFHKIGRPKMAFLSFLLVSFPD